MMLSLSFLSFVFFVLVFVSEEVLFFLFSPVAPRHVGVNAVAGSFMGHAAISGCIMPYGGCLLDHNGVAFVPLSCSVSLNCSDQDLIGLDLHI
jgi:hypothetical protein